MRLLRMGAGWKRCPYCGVGPLRRCRELFTDRTGKRSVMVYRHHTRYLRERRTP